ncbi:MAG: VCBS repeat-containing protein [Planctomycetota bacterium]
MRTLLILTLPCTPALGAPVFEDVSNTNLPAPLTAHKTMDAEFADLDNDGDLDLILAREWLPNVVLFNDGAGGFPRADALTLGSINTDSEDVAVADFNGDGRPDIAFANEDTGANELYLQNAEGGFDAASERMTAKGRSNAILAIDLTGDGHADILLGNDGQNTLLVGDGKGGFTDETETRLPALSDVTQDVEAGDVDDDGDLDVLVANEGDNHLLINNGAARFTRAELPVNPGDEETREGDLADIDNDGDLDILLANVGWTPGTDPRNRVLVNDGAGNFVDESDRRLPRLLLTTVDIDPADIDNDGDPDWITAEMSDGGPTVLLNDGAGVFGYAESHPLPDAAFSNAVDVELVDVNGDGRPDLYIAHFGRGDLLFFSIETGD